MAAPTTVPEVPEAQSTIQSKISPSTRKILLAVLAVLVLAGAAYGGYWYGQRATKQELPSLVSEERGTLATRLREEDETAGWEVYRNTDYGITFKYPGEYKVHDEEASTVEDLSLYIIDQDSYVGAGAPFISITLYEDDGLGLESWWEKHTTTEEIWGPDKDHYFDQVVDVGPCSVAGLRNCKQFYSGLRRAFKNVVFEREDRIYSVRLKTYRSLYEDGSALEQHFDSILSTLKFTEAAAVGEDETVVMLPARTIRYSYVDDWLEYDSPVGYSLQYPPTHKNRSTRADAYKKGDCSTYANDGLGGIISFHVFPYGGGSRRQLFYDVFGKEGYEYAFEEVLISGINSLVIERGPKGDSGTGVSVVVPKGNAALIVFWSNRYRDDERWDKLLGTIQVGQSLDISKCPASSE
ncbi:hypothetical protein L6258_03440 [Candidatus Parcubacteria bacterium]|nr:hypothetical protein [Candidatus Parcubacteria bacterium]